MLEMLEKVPFLTKLFQLVAGRLHGSLVSRNQVPRNHLPRPRTAPTRREVTSAF
jgi:hypothetical protein